MNCMMRHKRQCPQCRDAIFINIKSAPPNLIIKELCKAINPTKYTERLMESIDIMKAYNNNLPVFLYALNFPGQKLNLHLFEPRYRLMMQRVKENNPKEFALLTIREEGQPPKAGDVGIIVKCNELQFESDHRCLLTIQFCL